MSNRWPQKMRFKELMKDYQKRTGQTQEAFAEAIGVSLARQLGCLVGRAEIGERVMIVSPATPEQPAVILVG